MKTLLEYARSHGWDVTWEEAREAHPEVVENLSDYHRRRLRGRFETIVTRNRHPDKCLT